MKRALALGVLLAATAWAQAPRPREVAAAPSDAPSGQAAADPKPAAAPSSAPGNEAAAPPDEQASEAAPQPEEQASEAAADVEEDASLEPEQDPKAVTASAKKRTRRGNSDLSDDEAAAIGFASICCCGASLLALVGLVVWLVTRRNKASSPVQGNYPPQAMGPPSAPGTIQLSIFALALEPQAREVIEPELTQLGIPTIPTEPVARGRLVREAARALLTVQPSWRQFGYGEKPGMADLVAAEASYRTASEDFRARAASVGATATGGAGLVVVTLLVCSRRPLLGVSRLDDPQQVRTVLEDRMRVKDDELLGAELLWAPASQGGRVTEAELGLRFPEMLPLRRAGL